MHQMVIVQTLVLTLDDKRFFLHHNHFMHQTVIVQTFKWNFLFEWYDRWGYEILSGFFAGIGDIRIFSYGKNFPPFFVNSLVIKSPVCAFSSHHFVLFTVELGSFRFFPWLGFVVDIRIRSCSINFRHFRPLFVLPAVNTRSLILSVDHFGPDSVLSSGIAWSLLRLTSSENNYLR